MTDWRALYRLAEQQHRVIARRQLGGLGLPPGTVAKRADREGWSKPYPGVWVVPGTSPDRRTVASAALASVGPPAALCRRWAAWLHGLVTLPPSRVQILVPHGRRASAHGDRIAVLRSRTLQDGDLVEVDHLTVTSVPRTFLGLAATNDRSVLRNLLIIARQRGATDLTDVASRALRVGPVAGRGRLLRACRELSPAQVDSVFELEIRRRLAAAGLRPDRTPAAVRTHIGSVQVDIPFGQLLVGIECDGFGFHASPQDLDRDDRRHNALMLAGWRVLRLTWQRMSDDWPGFLAELRRALDTARGHDLR